MLRIAMNAQKTTIYSSDALSILFPQKNKQGKRLYPEYRVIPEYGNFGSITLGDKHKTTQLAKKKSMDQLMKELAKQIMSGDINQLTIAGIANHLPQFLQMTLTPFLFANNLPLIFNMTRAWYKRNNLNPWLCVFTSTIGPAPLTVLVRNPLHAITNESAASLTSDSVITNPQTSFTQEQANAIANNIMAVVNELNSMPNFARHRHEVTTEETLINRIVARNNHTPIQSSEGSRITFWNTDSYSQQIPRSRDAGFEFNMRTNVIPYLAQAARANPAGQVLLYDQDVTGIRIFRQYDFAQLRNRRNTNLQASFISQIHSSGTSMRIAVTTQDSIDQLMQLVTPGGLLDEINTEQMGLLMDLMGGREPNQVTNTLQTEWQSVTQIRDALGELQSDEPEQTFTPSSDITRFLASLDMAAQELPELLPIDNVQPENTHPTQTRGLGFRDIFFWLTTAAVYFLTARSTGNSQAERFNPKMAPELNNSAISFFSDKGWSDSNYIFNNYIENESPHSLMITQKTTEQPTYGIAPRWTTEISSTQREHLAEQFETGNIDQIALAGINSDNLPQSLYIDRDQLLSASSVKNLPNIITEWFKTNNITNFIGMFTSSHATQQLTFWPHDPSGGAVIKYVGGDSLESRLLDIPSSTLRAPTREITKQQAFQIVDNTSAIVKVMAQMPLHNSPPQDKEVAVKTLFSWTSSQHAVQTQPSVKQAITYRNTLPVMGRIIINNTERGTPIEIPINLQALAHMTSDEQLEVRKSLEHITPDKVESVKFEYDSDSPSWTPTREQIALFAVLFTSAIKRFQSVDQKHNKKTAEPVIENPESTKASKTNKDWTHLYAHHQENEPDKHLERFATKTLFPITKNNGDTPVIAINFTPEEMTPKHLQDFVNKGLDVTSPSGHHYKFSCINGVPKAVLTTKGIITFPGEENDVLKQQQRLAVTVMNAIDQILSHSIVLNMKTKDPFISTIANLYVEHLRNPSHGKDGLLINYNAGNVRFADDPKIQLAHDIFEKWTLKKNPLLEKVTDAEWYKQALEFRQSLAVDESKDQESAPPSSGAELAEHAKVY